MATENLITKARNWSSWSERQTIECELNELDISYEDFYPTCRPGVYQIEAHGNAKRLAQRLNASPLFSSLKPVQDWMEDAPYALVMFQYIEPEDPDDAAFYDSADYEYEDRRDR